MKIISTFSLLLLIFQANLLIAQTHSIIFFKGSFEQALALAKSQQKYIFIDCYTEWCGPCKSMDKNVFTNDSVADFYNKYFINYKSDMEKGQGSFLKKKFNVGFYPTFLFLKYDEEIMHRSIGVKTAEEFINLGKIALDTNSNFYAKGKKYHSEKKNPEDIYNYAIACYEAGVGFDANEYFLTQPDDSLLNKKNWYLISLYTSQTSSREFRYITKNRKKFSKKYNEFIVNDKIFKVFENDLVFKTTSEKDKNIDVIIDEILKPIDLDIKEIFKLRLKMFYYINITGQLNKFVPLAVAYISTISAKKMNILELNSICRNIYLNTNDLNTLKKVELWLQEGINKDDNYLINDAYSNVLFKEGKYDESLKAANEAIKIAEKINADCSDTKSLIDRIKNIKK